MHVSYLCIVRFGFRQVVGDGCLPCCWRVRSNFSDPPVPFPCWVAAEQKGGQAGGKYIAGHPSLGRDRSPLLAFLSLIWSYLAERGR